MKTACAVALCARLAAQRRVLHYFKDRYALDLLEHALAEPTAVSVLRRGPYGRLLAKPALAPAIALAGDGILRADHLAAAWPTDGIVPYTVAFGVWGEDARRARPCAQTSRPGANLVVRLNFDCGHDARYRALVDPHYRQPFAYFGHPVDIIPGGRNTLAWARIDWDADAGVVLIEEVQSDWVREAKAAAARAEKRLTARHADTIGAELQTRLSNAQTYWRQCMTRHDALWAEATLCAALNVARSDLGARDIFMHTAASGVKMKRIDPRWNAPPRSLYEELPKRFCFTRTPDFPALVLEGADRKLRKRLTAGEERFWRLRL